mmetsp:Transcript_14265/g.32410  ORF Transcript_14265/g.32410 Transcript_14265/m.32410 type:complete len:395 (+) Transcript_14265:1163-2347(+)
MKELKRLFKSLDSDGNGMLTRSEIEEVFNTGESDIAVLQQFGLDPVEVFDMMVPEDDDDAEISITEFVDTLSEVMESGLEMKRLEKGMKEVKSLLADVGAPMRTEKLRMLMGVNNGGTNAIARSIAARNFMSGEAAGRSTSMASRGRRARKSNGGAHRSGISASGSGQEGDDAGSDGAGFRPVYSSATSGNEMPDWAREMMQELREIRHTLIPIALQHGADFTVLSQDVQHGLDSSRPFAKVPGSPCDGRFAKSGSDSCIASVPSKPLLIEIPDVGARGPWRGNSNEGHPNAAGFKANNLPHGQDRQEQFLPGLNGATRPPCLSVDVLDDYSCPSVYVKTPKADHSPSGVNMALPSIRESRGRVPNNAVSGRSTPSGSALTNTLANAKRRREAL